MVNLPAPVDLRETVGREIAENCAQQCRWDGEQRAVALPCIENVDCLRSFLQGELVRSRWQVRCSADDRVVRLEGGNETCFDEEKHG